MPYLSTVEHSNIIVLWISCSLPFQFSWTTLVSIGTQGSMPWWAGRTTSTAWYVKVVYHDIMCFDPSNFLVWNPSSLSDYDYNTSYNAQVEFGRMNGHYLVSSPFPEGTVSSGWASLLAAQHGRRRWNSFRHHHRRSLGRPFGGAPSGD